ncbi:hypothetical protein AcV7_008552 [Taiwanofungus camphoratus]|nr:hypothetical protein AcV7_008552 [Antrodia cinnamomea]
MAEVQQRRSARLAAVKADDESRLYSDSTTSQSSSRVERQKNQTTGSRKMIRNRNNPQDTGKNILRLGKRSLSKLLDMPLDILFEIFGHLHPLDVLHLARTTKALRNVLMRRSSITIWKYAREHVEDLPDCPADLSEPQYARLLFDPHCHFCLTARVVNVMWNCRVRCCKRCLDANFMDLTSMFLSIPTANIRPGAMLPCEEVKNKLLFPKARVEELSERIKEILPDEEKLKQLESSRMQVTTDIEIHAEALEEWQDCQNAQRTMERLFTRFKRSHAIVSRLTQLGLAGEIVAMSTERLDAFINHPLVKQPRTLTDRTWNNIKDVVIRMILDARTERLAKERCGNLSRRVSIVSTVVGAYKVSRPPFEIIPNATDFCFMPEFREILDLPQEYVLGEHTFDALIPRFPECIERWRRSVSRELLDKLPPLDDGVKEGVVDFSRLELASTWFLCHWCDRSGHGHRINYPRVLVHKCMTETTFGFDWMSDTPDADLHNACLENFEAVPWQLGGLKLRWDEKLFSDVRKVLEACGKDINTTTTREMDELDPRLVCSACLTSSQVQIMSWRTAVMHDIHNMAFEWTCLNEADTVLIRREDAMRSEYVQHFCEIWTCVHCRSYQALGTLDTVKQHLYRKHAILAPRETVDFAIALDHSFAYPGPPIPRIYPLNALTTPLLR